MDIVDLVLYLVPVHEQDRPTIVHLSLCCARAVLHTPLTLHVDHPPPMIANRFEGLYKWKPVLGDKILGISIRRGFGAPNGVRLRIDITGTSRTISQKINKTYMVFKTHATSSTVSVHHFLLKVVA